MLKIIHRGLGLGFILGCQVKIGVQGLCLCRVYGMEVKGIVVYVLACRVRLGLGNAPC